MYRATKNPEMIEQSKMHNCGIYNNLKTNLTW